MKYLLLLLFTFNVHAQYEARVIKNSQIKNKAKFETYQEALDWVEDNSKILHRKRYRNSFGLVDRWLKEEMPGYTQVRQVPADEEMEIPGYNEYFYPQNYSVEYEDISDQVQAEKDALAARKAEFSDFRKLLNAVNNDADTKPYQKKIYRLLIKYMKE